MAGALDGPAGRLALAYARMLFAEEAREEARRLTGGEAKPYFWSPSAESVEAMRSFLSSAGGWVSSGGAYDPVGALTGRCPGMDSAALRREARKAESDLLLMAAASERRLERRGPLEAERDLGRMRLNVRLARPLPGSAAKSFRAHGFLWSPRMGAWTRALTWEAERSLDALEAELAALGANRGRGR